MWLLAVHSSACSRSIMPSGRRSPPSRRSTRIASALARRFPPEMTLLGALAANTAMAFDSLAQLIQRDAVNLYFTSPPQIPAGWDIVRAVELHQMVQETDTPSMTSDEAEQKLTAEVIELTPVDVPEMTVLYTATRPGRTLCPRIQKLGQFLGIREPGKEDGKLVAMGGLRLHLPGYREITTVATLPGHEGRGYATAIVRGLIERIRSRGDRPFLTVRTDNTRAVEIYHRLGFKERTLLYSRTIRRTQ